MRRLAIYLLLFPPLVWLYMCAVNRASPFGGSWFAFFSSIAVAYVFCFVPATLTGLAHHVLKAKGVRSILCVFVAAIVTPLPFFLFISRYQDAASYAAAGAIAAIGCWIASRFVVR